MTQLTPSRARARICTNQLLGYVEIVETKEFFVGGYRLGGYRIERDQDGNEISRTENVWNLEVKFA